MVNKINLKMNHIKLLLSFSFSNLNFVNDIWLDENLIEVIETNSFYNLPRIRIISLRNNKLRLIGENSFQSISFECFIVILDSEGTLEELANFLKSAFALNLHSLYKLIFYLIAKVQSVHSLSA